MSSEETPAVKILVDGAVYRPRGSFATIVYNGVCNGVDTLVERVGSGNRSDFEPMCSGGTWSRTAQALKIVRDYVLSHLDKSDDVPAVEPYVVWFSHILGFKKWLVSTNLPDGMYYEVTFNRDKDEYYLDAYKKFENRAYPGDYGCVTEEGSGTHV